MSLATSVVALVIVTIGVWVVQRDVKELRLVDKSLDAYAIVSDFKSRSLRLEELVTDQRIKLEVLQLRLKRALQSNEVGNNVSPLVSEDRIDPRGHSEIVPLSSKRSFGVKRVGSTQTRKPSKQESDGLRVDILRFVLESGQVSAKQVQGRIGRSREHTARVMNALFREGVVSREVSTRPYTYSLTEVGRVQLERGAT